MAKIRWAILAAFLFINSFYSYSRVTVNEAVEELRSCKDLDCQKSNLTLIEDSLLDYLGDQGLVCLSQCIYTNIDANLLSLRFRDALLSSLRETYDYYIIGIFGKLARPEYSSDLHEIYNKYKGSRTLVNDLMMENTLIKCGEEAVMDDRLKYLKKSVRKGDLDVAFNVTLKMSQMVANRKFVELLMKSIIDNNQRLAYCGEDGGECQYCSLCVLSITVLKEIIKDFPRVPNEWELIDSNEIARVQQWCLNHQHDYQLIDLAR